MKRLGTTYEISREEYTKFMDHLRENGLTVDEESVSHMGRTQPQLYSGQEYLGAIDETAHHIRITVPEKSVLERAVETYK